MKDFTGKEITVGCTIVYPGRRSSSMWVTRAAVLDIREPEGTRGGRLRVQPMHPQQDVAFGTPTKIMRVDLVAVIAPNKFGE